MAERITGLEILEIPRIGKKIGTAVTYAAYDDGVEVIRRTESGHSATLSAVVEVLYKRTSRRVFEEQSFLCFVCGRLRPLQADHIHPRARGRCDQRWNLRGVCAEDHQLITDNKLVDPQPHPKVLSAVQRHGWTWEPDSNVVGWHQLIESPTLDAVEATA
jgi:hypothetical protein